MSACMQGTAQNAIRKCYNRDLKNFQNALSKTRLKVHLTRYRVFVSYHEYIHGHTYEREMTILSDKDILVSVVCLKWII